MSVNIDSLDIEISAESSKAEKSLNSLISTLGRIKGAVEKASSLSSVTRRLDALSKAVQPLSSLNAQTEKIDKLVSSLKQLDTLKSVSIKPFIKSAEMLPSAVEKISNINVDTGKILNISNAFKAFSSLGKSNIVPFITNAKKLPEAVSALNAMPDIDTSKTVHIVSTLQAFGYMGKPNIAPFISNAKKIPEAVSALNGMESVNTGKLNQVVTALRTFETLGKNNINSFLNSLKKIPTIASELQSVDFDSFAESIQKASSAVKPLADEMAKISSGFNSLPTKIQRIIKSNDSLSSSTKRLSGSKSELSKILGSVKLKMAAYYIALKRTASILGDYLTKSNEYAENINLFTVAMGKAADESMNFAEKVNDLLGIDISEWIRNQGIFKSITSGFGVVTDKANLMSKNLTQIGYDIASFYNIDTDEAMTKVQSGISGELEPLRRLGYALDAATLQQVAYNHGIELSINKMTQAQKSQLRYVAIMEQSKNVMGDMARTVTSPANSMRILNQQFEQLKRAIGNIISVLAAKLIPYVQAFVRLMTEAADALAKAWGFELPEIDYSGLSVESLTDGVDDLSNALDDTANSADSAKKAMQRLAGFDEINVLRNNTDTSSNNESSAINTNMDLGIDLPEYDFLSGLEESSDEIYQKMKKFFEDLGNWINDNIPLIKTIAGLLAGLWVADKIKNFFGWLGKISSWFKSGTNRNNVKTVFQLFKEGFKTSRDKGEGFFTSVKNGFKNVRNNLTRLQKVAITAATTIVGAWSGYDFFYNVTNGTLNVQNGFLDIIGMAGSIGTAFALTGPVGGVVTTLGYVVGGIKGWIDAQDDLDKQFAESLIYNNGGTKISDIATAFSDVCTGITDSAQAFIDSHNNVENGRKDIRGINDEISKMLSSLGSADTNIKESAEKIKEAFGEMNAKTKDVLQEMQIRLKSALTGEDVNEALKKAGLKAEEANSLFDSILGEKGKKLQEYQNQINKLTKDYEAGIISQEEYASQVNDVRNKMLELTGLATEEQTNFINELSNIKESFSKIDFGSENDVQAAIQKIDKSGNEAITAVKEKYDGLITDFKNYISGIELTPEQSSIADKYLTFLNDQRETEVGKIASEMDSFYQDVISQIKLAEKEAKDEYWENANFGDWISYSVAIDTFQISWDTSYEDFVKSKTDEAYGKIYDLVSESRAKISTDIDEDAKETLSGIPEAVKQSADDAKKAITSSEALRTYKKDFSKLGDSAKSGFVGSLKDRFVVTDEAKKLTSDAVDAAAEGQKSHSPSKKYAELGLYAIQGYCQGITDNLRNITTNAAKIATTAISAVSTKTDFKPYGKQITDTFVQGLDTNNITVTFVNMFDVILAKMQIFANNMSKGMNTTLTNMVNSVNSVKVTNGTASLEKKMPAVTVSKMYATGGYPNQGEMFIARERGAELVGRIGNRTAVASNDQIVEGIKSGVYEAMVSAKGSESSDNQPLYIYTTVYLDNDEIYNSVEKRSRREFMRSNGRNKQN